VHLGRCGLRHFLFIGVVLSMIALVVRIRIPFPRWTELVPPYAIGTVAMFWVMRGGYH